MRIVRIVGLVVAGVLLAAGLASPVLAGEDDNHHPGRGHHGYGCRRVCPQPFPSSPGASSPGNPSATTTVTHSGPVSSSPAGPASSTPPVVGDGPQLPLTGVPISALVGGAVVVIVAGIGAFRWGRSAVRRPQR